MRVFAIAALFVVALGAVRLVADDAAPSATKLQRENAADWPGWRGPTRDGVAQAGQQPPLEWSAEKNVVWKSPVPGRGHGSPTVVGPHVYLTAAEPDEQLQSVLCFERSTGRELWKTVVHRGGFETKGNAKSSQASTTCACDGERVFATFLNGGAVHATALDLAGKILWQTNVSDFVIHQGFGASPALYGELVIVSADNKGTGAVAALDRGTGKIIWKNERPAKPNYTSPVLLNVAGREQLLFSGCDLVTSLEPATGKTLWEIEGATTECVTSVVTDGQRIFTSGGYPRNHIQAVRADGSGKTDWENDARVYVPSMIVKDGHLFASLDAGVAMCWNCESGDEIWKGRLGGTFSSSLILVGDNLWATNETGQTFIFEANPKEFRLLAENQLGSECFATPAVCGSRVYHRVAIQADGKRQEMLYCLGSER
jgi:outer membrane protein assembly factor BamB